MLASIGIVVFALLVMLIEVPSLVKKGHIKEIWSFFFLLFLGTGLSIFHVLKVDLPSPHDWIAFIYEPLSNMIYNFLK